MLAAESHYREGRYLALERRRPRDPEEELSQEGPEEKLEHNEAPLPRPVIHLTEKPRQDVERLMERMRANREMDMGR